MLLALYHKENQIKKSPKGLLGYAATFVILDLVLMQRVQARTRSPFSTRNHWRLGESLRIEARIECERFIVRE